MISFNIEIVEKVIKINALYDSSKVFFNDYLTNKKEEIELSINNQDIDYERSKADNDYYQDNYLETLAIYRKIVEELINYDVLLIHGSLIVKDNIGYLFTAPSGTGKTTHSNLWLKNIKGSYILNGDKPLIKIANDKVIAYGTPYQGKENYGINSKVELKNIILVKRDNYNHIEKVRYNEIFPNIFTQTYYFKDKSKLIKEMSLLKKLDVLSFYVLSCTKDDEAAIVAYKGMNNE